MYVPEDSTIVPVKPEEKVLTAVKAPSAQQGLEKIEVGLLLL